MRRGFSMLTALIFMVLVATLGALALSLSTATVKQTSDLYLREQAELLVQSATEYALLAISGHDFSANCLNTIHATYPTTESDKLFDINISLYYMGNGLPVGCQTLTANLNNIDTNESNLTVMIDTIVSSADGISLEPIRLHRRTIQKP